MNNKLKIIERLIILTDSDNLKWTFYIVRYIAKYKGVFYALYDDDIQVQCGDIKLGISHELHNSIRAQYERSKIKQELKDDKELELILADMKIEEFDIKKIINKYIQK